MIYGNPTYTHVQQIKTSVLLHDWKARGILDPLLQMPYPCEVTTQAELWDLVAKTRMVSSTRLNWCNWMDDHHAEGWMEYVHTLGLTYDSAFFQGLFDRYEPIITYLKFHYNRPRPFQTAGMYNIPVYPHIHCGSGESAYPSGHTFLALVAYDKLVKAHPELRKELMRFVLDVKLSREELGVHYVSDGLFSFQIYRHLKKFL